MARQYCLTRKEERHVLLRVSVAFVSGKRGRGVVARKRREQRMKSSAVRQVATSSFHLTVVKIVLLVVFLLLLYVEINAPFCYLSVHET